MLSSCAKLSQFEENVLNAWGETPAVKKLLKNEGKFALVFGWDSGVGMSILATVKDKAGNILSKDITDYNSW
jgi:hypothetical protein